MTPRTTSSLISSSGRSWSGQLFGPWLLGPLLLALLSASAPAAAARAPSGASGPEQEACVGRVSGDACTLPNNQAGACADSTCNRLDYSGGSPPKAIEEPCLVCKPGEPHDGPSAAKPTPNDPPASTSQCRVDRHDTSPAGLALLVSLGLVIRRRRHP